MKQVEGTEEECKAAQVELDKSMGYPRDVVLHNWVGPLPTMRFEHYAEVEKHPTKTLFALSVGTASTADKAVAAKDKAKVKDRSEDWDAKVEEQVDENPKGKA